MALALNSPCTGTNVQKDTLDTELDYKTSDPEPRFNDLRSPSQVYIRSHNMHGLVVDFT
jgi:hypothetical protein